MGELALTKTRFAAESMLNRQTVGWHGATITAIKDSIQTSLCCTGHAELIKPEQ